MNIFKKLWALIPDLKKDSTQQLMQLQVLEAQIESYQNTISKLSSSNCALKVIIENLTAQELTLQIENQNLIKENEGLRNSLEKKSKQIAREEERNHSLSSEISRLDDELKFCKECLPPREEML